MDLESYVPCPGCGTLSPPVVFKVNNTTSMNILNLTVSALGVDPVKASMYRGVYTCPSCGETIVGLLHLRCAPSSGEWALGEDSESEKVVASEDSD